VDREEGEVVDRDHAPYVDKEKEEIGSQVERPTAISRSFSDSFRAIT